MAKEVSFKALENFADCLAGKIAKNAKRYELLAASQAKATVKTRIFDGKDARDVPLTPKGKGTKEGAYSKGYSRKRKGKGRQTGRVDLQMTDRLFRSIQVANFKGRPALMILPGSRSDGAGTNQEIAGHLEKTYKTEIFAASNNEADAIAKVVARRLNKEVDKWIDQCFPNNAEITV
jgi:hypothetical protein